VNTTTKILSPILIILLAFVSIKGYSQAALSYPVVDTKQVTFYNNFVEISKPVAGDAFYGQDAQYTGYAPSYLDNGDGTVSDLVTGLMWQKTPDLNVDGIINVADKLSYFEALAAADTFSLAGYDDWRLPSIKEMYSLIVSVALTPADTKATIRMIWYLLSTPIILVLVMEIQMQVNE